MVPQEFVDLLEIPANAKASQIIEQLEKLIAYHQNVMANSKSEFLRRISSVKLLKLEAAKPDILAWTHLNNDEELVDEQTVNTTEENQPAVEPAPMPTPVELDEQLTLPDAPVAYLVKHTEHKPVVAFPLFQGKNYIGRKQQQNLTPFVALEDDESVSRVHAVVFVEASNGYYYFIEDSAKSNGAKASKNGTFINGSNLRISSRMELEENDTIQVGETKLALRINNKPFDEIVKEVENSNYIHTVVIRL